MTHSRVPGTVRGGHGLTRLDGAQCIGVLAEFWPDPVEAFPLLKKYVPHAVRYLSKPQTS